MVWSWMVPALAGNLYINGVFVDPATIAGVEMKDVHITFDAQGNIQVTAPGYKIEVVGSPTPPPAPRAPVAAPAPYPAPTPYPAPSPYVAPTPAPSPYAVPLAPAPGAPAALPPSNVAPARWWLVTEDNGSAGHTVEVLINGQVVRTLGSGQPQQIVDVGRWLRVGANQVEVRSQSTNAGGGTYYVYIGTGSDQSGTVVMEKPIVQYGLANNRSGATSRSFTLDVDR